MKNNRMEKQNTMFLLRIHDEPDICFDATDFTLVLTVTLIIVINVVMRSPTQRVDGIFRNGFTITALNWFDRLAIFPLVVFKKKLPVLFDKGFDDRKLIDLNF